MIELAAFASLDPRGTIPESGVTRCRETGCFSHLRHSWHLQRRNHFLMIQGDRPLEPFVYDSPRLTLVCYSDLLGSGDCSDYSEANLAPAGYLAREYERKGEPAFRDLHGWFGVLLYDHQEGALKAWTDHFGVRRLVYRTADGSLGVSSDLRLLNRLFERRPEVDPAAILEYLQYTCIPAPRTIFRECRRLQPGHRLTSRPSPAQHPYWDLSYDENRFPARSESEWSERTYAAIRSAVEKCIRPVGTPEELGCFLSGGTDSSSITGLVGQLTARPPRSFSIGFDDPRYNEISYARVAAKKFHAEHREYFVTPADILNLLEKAARVYDEPFGNSSIIPAHYCARAAAQAGVRSMLAGDGGDELFGGNQRYADDRVFQRYARVPAAIRSGVLEPCIAFFGRRWNLRPVDLASRYIRRASIPLPERIFSYDFLSSFPRADFFAPGFLKQTEGLDSLAAAKSHFLRAPAQTDLNRWLYLDLKIIITDNDLRKVTPMAELAGVEPRYPLLDPSLAEFSATIPAGMKVKGRSLRYLFKKAMRGLLPEEIIRKSKHGFGLPFSTWVAEHQPLHDFAFDILGSQACRQRGIFREDLLEWLWALYTSESRKYYGDILWVFLMLEIWHLSHSAGAN